MNERFCHPIFPNILPHYGSDISKKFQESVIDIERQASIFFEESGVCQFAREHGGVCTFWLNDIPVIYQVTNEPLLDDKFLLPSTAPAKEFLGNYFVGALSCDDPLRAKKRSSYLKAFANPKVIEGYSPRVCSLVDKFLGNIHDEAVNLEKFTMEITSFIDSFLPGMTDLYNQPLNTYLCSEKYGYLMQNYIEIVLKSMTTFGEQEQLHLESVAPLVKKVIQDNFRVIESAPETNIFKQLFSYYDIDFDETNISSLPDDLLKEIGVSIIALYDTTALSLYWLICHIENNPTVKQKIIEEAKMHKNQAFSYIDLVVLESTRFSVINPTVLYREVIESTTAKIHGKPFEVPKGVHFYLDRHAANRDPDVFPYPEVFNIKNIKAIIKKGDDNMFSLFSHGRYEINTFSIMNTRKNPRKCPARSFSLYLQSQIIQMIYGNYDVMTNDTGTEYRKHCVMSRPNNAATIRFSRKNTADRFCK